MHPRADLLPATALNVDDSVDREFEERLAECSTLAFRVAFSVLRHRQDAEDVAQDAFVKAHRSFSQLRDRERFRAWLVRMTWRLAIDHRRSSRRRTIREMEHSRVGPVTTEDDVIAREQSAQLWDAVDALPDKLRIVVVLSAMEGHDTRDVSRLLDVPEGTVKSRLFAARQQLKERLK